ncbi:hypothetical protein LIG30_3003 [Burkholderia sp. lig30]|jgi:hypothetical protein|uniref:hypothetical protein n=1 Tax=Burkholderia sp. lig30 TaxID=1192124 RepID=UPI000460B072|nr:hypothetical protein [Burkholderia sp. lig30]KDB07801.1 hypothetical protein LIG30_3003 [Burkholderia sp. lig30]
MATTSVSIINASTVLTDAQVQAAVPALQTQVHRDFAPAWGIDADLTFIPTGAAPAGGSWWLTILDNSDQAGALGYHDVTNEGLPLGKVFAGTDIQNNAKWTVTASHELLEMLADPEINLTVFVQPSATAGVLYAYEVCDACEADQFGYDINGVAVSDFVYPAWFEAFRNAGSARFDHGERLQKPVPALLAGGYIGAFDVAFGGGWNQITAEGRLAYQMRPHVGSRRERRRTPRDQWLPSSVKFGKH